MKQWRELLYIRATHYTPDSTFPDDGVIVWTDMHTGEQIEIEVTPLWCGGSVSMSPQTLLEYLSDDDGWKPLLEAEGKAIGLILNTLRTAPDVYSIGVVTVWSCEAGTSYVPGEADEWEADAQLTGYLNPTTHEFVHIDNIRHEAINA